MFYIVDQDQVFNQLNYSKKTPFEHSTGIG